MKKKFLFRLGYILLIILTFVIGYNINIRKNQVTSISIEYDAPITHEDRANKADYIFIAKVGSISNIKTQWNKLELTNIYTYYEVDVLAFLKGTGETKELLCYLGGRDKNNNYMYVNNETEEPNSRDYYIFFANRIIDGDKYKIKDSFNIFYNNQKVKLDGYNPQKSYLEQDLAVKTIIDEYLKYLNQVQ